MSLDQAMMMGAVGGTALIMYGGIVLSRSEDEWINWAGMLLFAASLLNIVAIFALVYELAVEYTPTSANPETMVLAMLVVSSVVLILWAMILLIQVFWGAGKASYEVIRQFLNRIGDAQDKVRR